MSLIIRRTLYARLATALFVLVVILGAAFVDLIVRTARDYANELNQKLQHDLARRLVEAVPPGPGSSLGREDMSRLFDSVMAINPAVEVYLLDGDGTVRVYAAPDDHIKRRQVDVAPIQKFIRGDRMPILGDDPKSANGRKVFSVAPITLSRTPLRIGYLYVILGGQVFDSVMQLLASSYILKLRAWIFAASLALWLTAALVTFNVMTRRLSRLMNAMESFQRHGFSDSSSDVLSARHNGDEIDQLIIAFTMMTGRLSELVDRLHRKETSRLELVANVAHDLRRPLTALQMYVEALGERPNRLTEREQEDYFNMVAKHTERLGRLISELQQLANLESDDTQIRVEPLSLCDLAQDVYLGFTLLAEQRGVRYELSIPEGSCYVSGDVSLLERAIENLIDNALRYSAPGGTVRVQVTSSADRVSLAVTDTGHGIAEEDLPFILRRRYRASDVADVPGVGLGLAIVNRIVEMHEATLKVVSTVDAGSEFSFDLPKFTQGSTGS